MLYILTLYTLYILKVQFEYLYYCNYCNFVEIHCIDYYFYVCMYVCVRFYFCHLVKIKKVVKMVSNMPQILNNLYAGKSYCYRDFLIEPASIELFPVNNTNTRKNGETYSKLTIKAPQRSH